MRAGESVRRWLPVAMVFKAFNHVGNAHMVNPQFPDGPPTMLICGNDAGAKKIVTGLLEAFGWPAKKIFVILRLILENGSATLARSNEKKS